MSTLVGSDHQQDSIPNTARQTARNQQSQQTPILTSVRDNS